MCACGRSQVPNQCSTQKCEVCCDDSSCKKHGKKCPCGKICQKLCSTLKCKNCCHDSKCPSHGAKCPCRRNLVPSDLCITKVCYRCCIDIACAAHGKVSSWCATCSDVSCAQHQGLCPWCGKGTAKKCNYKRCDDHCKEQKCKKHATTCSCGDPRMKKCPNNLCIKCCYPPCDQHGKKNANAEKREEARKGGVTQQRFKPY